MANLKDLIVRGASRLIGDLFVSNNATIGGTLTLTKTQDAIGTANNSPALIVGGPATGAHIEIDPDEIMAKANGTSTAALYLNHNGGVVYANGNPVGRFTATPTTGQVVVTDGTTGGVKTTGYTIAKSVPSDANFSNTTNTAGSTDTSSKIFLIGATTQAANPQTYSHDTAYVGTNGHLYSASKEVLVGGSNASSSVTITPTTTDVYSMTSAGSVTAGTAPSLTFAMDTTDTKKLKITFSAGTTPSTVTLPGRSSVIKAWTGYSAATAAAQTFTGSTS